MEIWGSNEALFRFPNEAARLQALRQTTKYYGAEQQQEFFVEECAEAIVANKHYQRKRCSFKKVIEEMADVSLMTDTLLQWAEDNGIADAHTIFQRVKDVKLLRILECMQSSDKKPIQSQEE